MKISVIVPVYNTEKYLNRCIESILTQTFSDLELLLIDDGSTDRSGEICDAYAAKDARVKVFHKENGGVSRARNLGIENAKGEYLSFIDSDDSIRPTMYEELLGIAERFQVDLVGSDLLINGKTVCCNNIAKNEVIDEERIKREILPAFTFQGNIALMEFKNKIFRRNAIADCRFPEGICYQEDLIFMIRVYSAIRSMYYLPSAFYEYVPLPTGLYLQYRKSDGKNFLETRRTMLALIEKNEIAINVLNFNLAYLYNITWFIFRTLRMRDKKEKKDLIEEVLLAKETMEACVYLKDHATSFDRRIAAAIAQKKIRKAIFLIKFVHSGKAAKLQKIIGKLKGKR